MRDNDVKCTLTNTVTPHSTVLENLTTHRDEKFPPFYGTGRFTACSQQPLVPSQINPVYALRSHFSKTYFNVILPSTLASSKWYYPMFIQLTYLLHGAEPFLRR